MTERPQSILILILVVLASSRSVAADDKPFLTYYKAGLDGIEAEDWVRAAAFMRKAINERGKEARRLPKYLYLKPYLPYFYLGLAEFKRGDCNSAERYWSISERQGVIRRRPQHEQIVLARQLCQTSATRPQAANEVGSRSSSATSTPPPPNPAAQQVTAPPPVPAQTPPPVRKTRRASPPPPPPPPSMPPPSPPSLDLEAQPHRLLAPGDPPSMVLLEAATAFLDGSYQQVVDQLSADAPAEAFARAHAQLLSAAAELALYLAGGERDAGRLEQARGHVLAVRAALPDLEPPARFFSPRFLDFFYGQRPEEER